jgi:hypothetical protein
MSDPEDHSSDIDDFDPSFGPDFDVDLVDDVSSATTPGSKYSQSAWQRLDERRDAEWLREQLSDWDDWDEFGDDADLH